MNNIVIKNIEPQSIKISGAGEVIGITAVYVNGVNVTEGSVAYVIVPTKTSELENNSGFITEETDPTIPYYIKQIRLADITRWNNKQDELVSGVNIKTINSNSLLGSGNIDISTSYTAGTGIEITEENVINNTITSYDDLTDLPTIPTKISDLTNDSDFVESTSLAEVAFNGSYLALSNTPDSTSDFTNDGENGVDPFITNKTNSLENYYNIDYMWNILPHVSDSDTNINLSPTVSDTTLKMSLDPSTLSQDGTPTPDSPEDIHTISGSNKVVVNGKNLFNKNNIKVGYRFGSDGDYYADAGYNATNYYINVKPSTTYSTSWGIQTVQCVCTYDINKIFIRRISSYSTSFTTDANEYFIRACVNDNNLATAQIEVGSTATTYQPYISQEADIDLDTIEYCKIGNYEDKFIRNSGKNLFDKTIEQGGISTSDGSNTTNSNRIRTDSIIYLEAGTYTINASGVNNVNKHIYSTSGTWESALGSWQTLPYTFTLNETKGVKFVFRKSDDSTITTSSISEIMLNKGPTALPYEPYGSNEWYIKKNIGKVV